MYGAIVVIWIALPTYVTTMGCLATDIVKGMCVPWGVYSSYAAEKTITSSIFLIAMVLPLTLMVFCYSRIVYALSHKVSRIVVGKPVAKRSKVLRSVGADLSPAYKRGLEERRELDPINFTIVSRPLYLHLNLFRDTHAYLPNIAVFILQHVNNFVRAISSNKTKLWGSLTVEKF